MPANKNNPTDSLQLNIQAANEILISGEDSLLHIYADKKYPEMKRADSGLWYLPIESGQSDKKVKDLEKFSVTYEVLSLDSTVLYKKNEKPVLGKKQLINGIEEGVKLMHKGDKMLLVIPWYLAYGMKGDGDKIPPYTSVMVIIKLNP